MLAALERGVNDFLIKPLRSTELLARINSQVGYS
jgi:DNA-binding response OmpR family regulator